MTDTICICICTHKRPAVIEALRSLAKLQKSDAFTTNILVADNDAEPTAKPVIETARRELGLDIKYVHAPKHNISTARNACLDHAEGNLVAFIDDDEIASPEWLLELYRKMKTDGLDIVFGPVWAVYPDGSPEWIKQLNVHSVTIQTPTPQTGHSGNVLMNVEHEAIKDRRFNPDRGQTGGEDTQFFFECNRAGARLGYAEEAKTTEKVPVARLDMQWMRRAKFRSGVTYGLLKNGDKGVLSRLMDMVVTSVKVAVCYGLFLVTFPMRRVSVGHYLRAAFHAGVFASGFNAKEDALYG